MLPDSFQVDFLPSTVNVTNDQEISPIRGQTNHGIAASEQQPKGLDLVAAVLIGCIHVPN